jgi:hypothetical protein
VAARAAAARRGEAGAGQREAWKAAGKAQESTWHSSERRGGGGCMAHGRRSGSGASGRETEEEGLEVDEGDLFVISQSIGTPL